MDAFAVISLLPVSNTPVQEAIVKQYPSANLAVSPYMWLVADKGKTTQDVCTKLNVMPGGTVNVIVLKVDNYFGVASPSIWEWLRVKAAEQ
jgi:hypothetical protein